MNEEIQREFLKLCNRQNISEKRVHRYVCIFKELQELTVNLEGVNVGEADKYFFFLKNFKYKQWTRVTKWKMFRKICKFIKSDVDFSQYKFKAPDMEPEILTMNEIYGMVSGCKSFRDKLIILLLYESGIRPGELIDIKKENVIFDDNGALIYVNGKTGQRPVRVIRTAEILRSYISVISSQRVFDISLREVEKIVDVAATRAGIKRKVSPKLFRHTRATHLASKLTEMELRIFFGWTKDSTMPKTYIHLSARDVDSKIIRIEKSENSLINF